jgi:uncharacterized membrane protein YphA (DoxX/SURF4 family)
VFVDRSYSRFPAGSVGVALVLLRVVDGFALVIEATRLSSLLLESVLLASAVALTLGLRTSAAGAAGAIGTAASMMYVNEPWAEKDGWLVIFALVFIVSIALVLAGPGAYSLEAKLSGWRRISLSSGKAGGYVDR